MMKVRNLLFMASLFLSVTAVKAQNNHIETTISADFVSQYIWRGQDLGNVSLQPTLGVGYKGLSLSAWGNIGISNPADTKEFDLTIGYTVGGFNIGITDGIHKRRGGYMPGMRKVQFHGDTLLQSYV